ncbi:DNA polymerase epsilon subunit D [[Candida] jaroonii]|uniref:DNA polymerase epsilon subunit D n=1 Tax=[Candida] jaroonii TaxID=467808 RepID=A0ACA9Y239_9ASCO|nr:DNA polymerase epsilon subunit D [[Candida] jaroonii]
MDPNSINPQEVELREQDRWLPIANVARLMKNTLPTSAKVSKDAKECMQECVSEFISFVTSEASDRCLREKRKTINGEDILFSMHDLGFENYAEVLKIFLAKYREQQAMRQERGEVKMTKRQLKAQAAQQEAQRKAHQEALNGNDINEELNEEEEEIDDIPANVKLENGMTNGSDSSESFFDQYENNNDHLEHDKEKKDYEYDDFINDPTDHQNIDELAKQLTNDEPDIDTLTAGITNNGGNGYF